jgi:hypothetical protein
MDELDKTRCKGDEECEKAPAGSWQIKYRCPYFIGDDGKTHKFWQSGCYDEKTCPTDVVDLCTSNAHFDQETCSCVENDTRPLTAPPLYEDQVYGPRSDVCPYNDATATGKCPNLNFSWTT